MIFCLCAYSLPRFISLRPFVMIWNEDWLCGSKDAFSHSAIFKSWCWWEPAWCRTTWCMSNVLLGVRSRSSFGYGWLKEVSWEGLQTQARGMRHRNKGHANEKVWAKNKYRLDTREIIGSCCIANHQLKRDLRVLSIEAIEGDIFLYLITCWTIASVSPGITWWQQLTVTWWQPALWNWWVWIQWRVDREDNYFLCSALYVGLSPWGCAIPGWLEVVLKDCISGLPSSRLAKEPAVLRSPRPSVPVCYQALWFTQQTSVTLPALGLPPDHLVKGHGLQHPDLQGQCRNKVMDMGVVMIWGSSSITGELSWAVPSLM